MPELLVRLTAALLAGLILALAGPANAEPTHDHHRHHAPAVEEAPAPEGPAFTMRDALDTAVRRNPRWEVLRQRVFAARAELHQAGLLENPWLEAKFRGDGGTEVGLSFDLLELFRRPAREEVARSGLTRAEAEATAELLHLQTDVKTAVHTVQGLRRRVQEGTIVTRAARAMADLAQRQYAAGTMNARQAAWLQADAVQAEVDLARLQQDAAEAELELGRLLGTDEPLAALEALPPLPHHDPGVESLEAALAGRPDLAAARAAVRQAQGDLDMQDLYVFDEIRLGVETGPEGTGPTLAMPLPIFDTRAAATELREAEVRRLEAELAGLDLAARAEIRTLLKRLATDRFQATALQERLLPLRGEILEFSLKEYHAMLIGTYELLAARQEQARARLALASAQSDYWITRARLEAALGTLLIPEAR